MTKSADVRPGRKLQQWGYAWYSDGNRRWIYWGIPVIAIGVAVFVFALVLYLYRRRRVVRPPPLVQQPQPVYGTPVIGWPDYSSQYHSEYTNFGSHPPPQASSQTQTGKEGGVELGIPPPGYPSSHHSAR